MFGTRKQKIATSIDDLIAVVQNWNRSFSNPPSATDSLASRKRNFPMESDHPAKKMKLNRPEESGPPMSTLDLLQEPRQKLAAVVRDRIQQLCETEFTDRDFDNLVVNRIAVSSTDPTSVNEHGDVFLPCQALKKVFRKKSPAQIAQEIGEGIAEQMLQEFGDVFSRVMWTDNGFINVYLQPSFLGRIIDAILNEDSFCGPLPAQNEKVMVEYSQPNTHKSFHVGHMRNAALGDSLVRCFEHCGFDVVAANYFGDEGTHVAKCLWLLDEERKMNGSDLASVPTTKRGEFLGSIYVRAVAKLDWKTYTNLPFKSVRVAQVTSIAPHPNEDAPANLRVVTVDLGHGEQDTVICGGTEYKEGDYVPHKYAANAKEFFGVPSRGVILSAGELGVDLPPVGGAAPESGKKKKKKKGKKGKKDKRIWILNNIVQEAQVEEICGRFLADLGRKDDAPLLPEQSVHATVCAFEDAAQGVLVALEEREKYWTDLWEETRQWSLDEFERIYEWFGCRFDRYFYESQCSVQSQALVDEFLDSGIFIESNGCIGCDLGKPLGFCMLRKSNGAGLYATKDLFLAKLKFEEEKIDQSIYVVDSGQTLHFRQVFSVLNRMGYQQAEKCHHEAYGQVRLPSGKMSSRAGTVQLFSSLKEDLAMRIEENFLSRLRDNGWPEQELQDILQAVSVGTMRYGMLDHDTAKDIVFNLDEWLDPRGNTGSYLMYQCARVSSIAQKVPYPENARVDYSVLNSELERDLLLNMALFQQKVFDVINVGSRKESKMNPSGMCTYLYGIATKFSRWYSQDQNNIQNCTDPDVKATRLNFVNSVALVLRTGLGLLGIPVLRRM